MSSLQTRTHHRRIVIFGENGFIARALIDKCRDTNISYQALSSQKIDLLHPDAPDKISDEICDNDQIIFLPAITPDKRNDSESLVNNTLMGHHFVEGLRTKSNLKLVYVSTDAVYGSQNFITETTSPAPNTYYSVAHLAREIMVQNQSNIDVTIVRPTVVYGQHDTHANYGPNRFFRAIKQGDPIKIFGDGQEKRSYIYIEDLCMILLRALDSQIPYLNAAHPVPIDFVTLAHTMLKVSGAKVPVEHIERRIDPGDRIFNHNALWTLIKPDELSDMDKALQQILLNPNNPMS